MIENMNGWKRDAILVAILGILTLGLYLMPTDYEERSNDGGIRCKGEVLEVNNADLNQYGIIKAGDQEVTMRLLDGPYEGEIVTGNNPVLGQMHRDKIFHKGDTAFVVITPSPDGGIGFVNPQEHYRIDLEFIMLGLLALALILFGGWTGIKALLSFIFSAFMLWKVLIPLMLQGYDPILLSLGVVFALTAAIIFLVGGLTKRGLVAFIGAALGICTSCLLAIYFTDRLHIHGAVMPFSETLLYAGYAHLNLTEIYVSAVFLAASGAVMDLAMDVSASMYEVVCQKPNITTMEALRSGLTVGRAVVGTMTTTLLLAYSGGYITLLMAFMAQGIPLSNIFNLIYVAAEVLKTLVGSFGLVMVAPFTAFIGAFVFTRGSCTLKDQ